MFSRKTLVLMLSVALAGVVGARVIQVPEDVRPNGDINTAIGKANNGDTISVWGIGTPPFVYVYSVVFAGKNVFVANRSYLPARYQPPAPYNYPDSTWVALEGRGNGPTGWDSSQVYFVNGEGHGATITGFTLEWGTGYYWQEYGYWTGGGVTVDGASPTIKSNYFLREQGPCQPGCTSYGGAICLINSENAVIEGNRFECCCATYGGAIETHVWTTQSQAKSL
jgi:hypothetical protein